MTDLITIGQKITAAREAAGISQKELADRIGSVQCQISEYERGECNMAVTRLMEIAKALGVEAAELVE